MLGELSHIQLLNVGAESEWCCDGRILLKVALLRPCRQCYRIPLPESSKDVAGSPPTRHFPRPCVPLRLRIYPSSEETSRICYETPGRFPC